MEATAWTIILLAVLGAIVGSFLNVVIFRLPRGLSIVRPRWSFCPSCGRRIRPHDNIPVLSWLLLRARCRDCGSPISVVYPAIECATVLVFLMVWDALFLAKAAPSAGAMTGDLPLAVAYLTLFAGLLATSVMDIESYTIDIRVSLFVTIVGVVCHAVWGLPDADQVGGGSAAGGEPTGVLPPAICAVGLVMGATWLVTALGGAILHRTPTNPPVPPADADVLELDCERHCGTSADPPSPPADDRCGIRDGSAEAPPGVLEKADEAPQQRDTMLDRLCIVLLGLVLVALLAWQIGCPDRSFFWQADAGFQRALLAGVVFMLMLVLASLTGRDVHEEVIGDIEARRAEARPMAWRELVRFVPALCAGVVLFVFLQERGWLGAGWREVIQAAANQQGWATWVAGAASGTGSAVLAAGLGWSVRILGTLAFGKEAFGTGDIYILAAIGAVAGFWAVVFVFFLAAILALVGVLATAFHRSTRAIPFGPWLALGAYVTLWAERPLLNLFAPAGRLCWSVLTGQPTRY